MLKLTPGALILFILYNTAQFTQLQEQNLMMCTNVYDRICHSTLSLQHMLIIYSKVKFHIHVMYLKLHFTIVHINQRKLN